MAVKDNIYKNLRSKRVTSIDVESKRLFNEMLLQ